VYFQIIRGQPVGNKPPDALTIAFLVIGGIGVPALIFFMKLIVETTFEGVRVRFVPFVNRLIRYDEIRSAEAKSYSPLREYGGWGIRGVGKKIAYNARGNEGVLLTLKDGGTIMLGSQRAPELEQAIRAGLKTP